ncbi:MAG: hypothetical protein KJ057_06190 [Phycisphaerae bacterium]|nr:MAG: hypothetical protein EDS66_00910 [Planctomycetota bacterium]KAB2949350.1 MAG: hypothetical protein F9K17_03165 [Phycisphaerae bacterium]MBE7458134.1 hypothetical protein [Planctomycetia bacterium]MCK6464400.1 hypothetical protein [Phycisphaerae bacterium]MCL4718048.1 hypothetical protein [Phycisphaerae bacterium]
MNVLAEVDIVLLASRAVHIAAAIVAVGGAFFARSALLPGLREALDECGRERVHEAVRRRWAKVVHVCIALLLITGGFNFWRLALEPKISPMPYHPIFGVKLLTALFIFFAATALVGTSPGFAGIRAKRAGWLGAVIAAGALIVILSGVLSQVRQGG